MARSRSLGPVTVDTGPTGGKCIMLPRGQIVGILDVNTVTFYPLKGTEEFCEMVGQAMLSDGNATELAHRVYVAEESSGVH